MSSAVHEPNQRERSGSDDREGVNGVTESFGDGQRARDSRVEGRVARMRAMRDNVAKTADLPNGLITTKRSKG
jgi:hypothetical protein